MSTTKIPLGTGRICGLVLVGWLASGRLARAGDWPEFLGPGHSGVSEEVGLAREWPAGGPKVLWTVQVGAGFASPAVRDGQVFLLDREGKERDVLRVLELSSGKELWRFGYDVPGEFPNCDGSRNTPTVEEKFIYTVGAFGHLHCIDRATRRPVWSANLVEDFRDPEVDRPGEAKNRREKLLRAAVPMWGFTQSPVMYEDMLILAPQTQKVGLVAYEKLTGKKRWESGYIGRNWFSHVSPVLMRLGGVDQVIMLAQPSDPEKSPAQAPPAIISSIDPKTGKILWQAKTPRPYKIPMPLPLRVAEDEIYITGGYGMGSVWVGVKCVDGKWTAGVVRESRAVAGNMHSPVLYREHIYLQSFKEYGATASGLVCMDLKGGIKWASGPGVQFNSGGMVVADGMIYIMNGKTGELSLVEARPEGFAVLGKGKVLGAEGGVAWGTVALSEGRLLVRDGKQLKCLDVRRP